MNLLKKWWVLLFALVFVLFIVWVILGGIISEITRPSIDNAPYTVIDSDDNCLCFKHYTIWGDADYKILQIDAYYISAFPRYGWDYVEKKVFIFGTELTGFGVIKRK